MLTVPHGVVPLEVLDEQAGGGDVVAVDDDAVATGVGPPAVGVAVDAFGEALDTVVAPPHPGVSISTWSLLTSRAVSVLPMCGPPTRKYTSDSVIGLRGVLWLRPCLRPTRSSTGDSFRPASMVTPATTTPGTPATSSGTAPLTAVRVACPMPSTIVSGRRTSMLRATSYTPGVSSRCRPRASSRLMTCTGSDGRATKKSLIGMVRPGVIRSPQVMPRVSRRTAGTRTWYLPLASTNRYGFSRLSGVVSSVVYGGSGNPASSGAPTTPANTWFHTALDQLSTSLLRVSHCCCEPFVVAGSRESAMKPPLAYCGPLVQ